MFNVLQVSSISSKLGAALQVGESNVWKPPAEAKKPARVGQPARPTPISQSTPAASNEGEVTSAAVAPPVGLPKQPEKAESSPFQAGPLGQARPLQPSAFNPLDKKLAPLGGDADKPRQPVGAHLPSKFPPTYPEPSAPNDDDDDDTGSVEAPPEEEPIESEDGLV